jgi:plasmid stabilization system protein ParE
VKVVYTDPALARACSAAGRYPYKIFYRVRAGTVEILHIHHAAREPWGEQE